MDMNNRVVMGDGSTLPHAEGEGGTAKQICDCMVGNTGPTSTNASNIEVVAVEVDYDNEPEELAILGSMEFKVFLDDRTEKAKKAKPYDCYNTKKGGDKVIPEVPLRPRDPQPNRAYIELPPTILKCVPPAQALHLPGGDHEMKDSPVPVISKGKQREQVVVVTFSLPGPEGTSEKSKECVSAPKDPPRFEVTDPKSSNDKMRNQLPQYKYVSELMNETNLEQVFQKLMDQPVMMRLGEVLGSSYDLGKRLQLATRSQRFPVHQVKAANIEIMSEVINKEQDLSDTEECLTTLPGNFEFTVESGKASSSRSQASTEELHEMTYQNMMQEEFHHQFAPQLRDVDLARPHEYCAMVTARLNG